MAYPIKPSDPQPIDPSDPFATNLEFAWLIVGATSLTITDFSGNAAHGTGTNYSLGSFVDKGTNQWALLCWPDITGSQVTRLHVPNGKSGGLATGEWTRTIWLVSGALAGSKSFVWSRTGDRLDFVFDPATRKAQFFSGATWLDWGGATTVTGVPECWTIANSLATGLVFYKNGVYIDRWASALQDTGVTLSIFSSYNSLANTLRGELIAIFSHARLLTDAEIAAHVADPFTAFAPASSGPVDPLAPKSRVPNYSRGAGLPDPVTQTSPIVSHPSPMPFGNVYTGPSVGADPQDWI